MIRISLGNVGSGKTANEVREMVLNRTGRRIMSNIQVPLDHVSTISADMILKKEVLGQTKKRDGSVEDKVKFSLNMEYWKNLKEPVSVVLDEAHAIMDARSAMTKQNKLISQWIALIRRVLGQSPSGEGELVLITQLPNRIDVIAREMAHQVRYHRCHYLKRCTDPLCGTIWREHNEIPSPLWKCPRCNKLGVEKFNHVIEIWYFQSMQLFLSWRYEGLKTYYRRHLVNDIESYFPLYSTLQWENMFNDF